MHTSLESKILELNTMILEGKALEAFEKFYAEDVVMQENAQTPTRGKKANLEREVEFFRSITEFRSAQVLSVGVSQDKTYVEWFFDYTHKDWGLKKYHQVAVQTWKDGKIVKEQFYYGG